MQENKSHIEHVIGAVSEAITREKGNLEKALADKKKAIQSQQSNTTPATRNFWDAIKNLTATTAEAPYSITLLTKLIGQLEKALNQASAGAFSDTTWHLLTYLQHEIKPENLGQGRQVVVVETANQRRTALSKTLSEAYKTEADQARQTHEDSHPDETRRLTKFKASLSPQEKKEERKVLSWAVRTLRAREGNTEEKTLIDSYHTLKNIKEAEEKNEFYQAAELKKSGIALQTKYLEQLGMNKLNNEFLEKKDTEKMEHRVDALEALTRDQKHAPSRNAANQRVEKAIQKDFTFYALIKEVRNPTQAPLLPNPNDTPQPAEQDKTRAKAALENYLVIKALGDLQATHFQDIKTLQPIVLFLMQTTLLDQNTALPTSFTTLRNGLKAKADRVLATAKEEARAEAEAEAKQASPALDARQTALKLQLAQMAITHYSENPSHIQSEDKEEYFTGKIKPAMEKVDSLNKNDLSFWLAYFSNGDKPNPYAIQTPDNADNNALFYALEPKKYTESEVRAREEKAREAANQRVTVLQTQLNQIQDELTAQTELNRQLPPLQKELTQALAEAETARAEAKTAQAEAKRAQSLQKKLTQALAEAKTAQAQAQAQSPQTQLNQEGAGADAAEEKAQAQEQDPQAQLRAAKAPSLGAQHLIGQLVATMGAAIAYLILFPLEKGKVPPTPHLVIMAVSFAILSGINYIAFRWRADSHKNQVAPAAGGG